MCARILDHIIRISDHFKKQDVVRFYKRGNCQMIKTTDIKKISNPSLCRDNHDQMVTWMYALAAIERTPWQKCENKYGEVGMKKTIKLIGSPLPYHWFCSVIRCDYEYTITSIVSDLTVNEIDFAYMARSVFHNLRSLRETADETIKTKNVKKI